MALFVILAFATLLYLVVKAISNLLGADAATWAVGCGCWASVAVSVLCGLSLVYTVGGWRGVGAVLAGLAFVGVLVWAADLDR